MKRLNPISGRALLALALLSFALTNTHLSACSTFVLRSGDQIVFGRNYDWHMGRGLVFVNQAGMRKHLASSADAPGWVSKFGSVSFNQYGKEQPMDGINEAGLVVAQMMLSETVYPPAEGRMTLGDLRWIQYQLDNSATVEDVIQSDAVVRIRSDAAPLHFLVADKTGDVAVIEFLAGQLVVHRGAELPVAALTNTSYDQSVAYLGQFVGFGGSAPIPQSSSPLDRFARLADRLSRYSGAIPPVDYAFQSLVTVAQSGTQWSIVYEVTGGRAHFRTRQSPFRKTIDLAGVQLPCRYAPKMIDIDSPLTGDVTAFLEPYTVAANRDLIYQTYRGTDWLKDLPDSFLDWLAALPDSFLCCRPRPVRPARLRDAGTRTGAY